MKMFDTGFYSPYATCHSPVSDHSQLFFPTPFHWIYGILGALGFAMRISDYYMLGIANGLGAFLFLLSVYHFLKTVSAYWADRCFAIYAWFGGLGGPLFLLCAVCGITKADWFPDWFYRYAVYDLKEGSNLASYLICYRLNYTLPMALGFAGLTAFVIARDIRCRYHLVYAWLMLYATAYLNLRYGLAFMAIAVLHNVQFRQRPVRESILACAPLAAGAACAILFMLRSPAYFSNASASDQQAMWFSSFLSAAFPLLIPTMYIVLQDSAAMPKTLQTIIYTTTGYIVLFGVLFVGHQTYYGTLMRGSDLTSALAMSDFALLGALAGAVYGAIRAVRVPRRRVPAPDHGWYIVWALVFIALTMSAFANGWFLRFGPQRLMPFLGLPLSMLTAVGLERLRSSRPRVAFVSNVLLVVCSVCSLVVAISTFQGPLGMKQGLASELGMKTAYMSQADAACIQHLGEGVVAAPAPFNDIISLHEGNTVLGGYGASELSDKPAELLDTSIARFFGMDASREERGVFLQQWCVKYVFLPTVTPRLEEIATELERVNGLQLLAQEGDARLYVVR